jgi:hypothetical protein
VSPANIVRKYSTGFPLLVICRTNSFTIVYRCKQCNVLGDCLEATSPGAATKIRTFENTSPTPHLGNKMGLVWLLTLLSRLRFQPQGDVLRLHRLPYHPYQVAAQGIQVCLVA